MIEIPAAELVDFKFLFESVPGRYLVLDPDLVAVAVSDAYLRATKLTRASVLGHNLFAFFAHDPTDAAATGRENLRESLHRVRRDLIGETLPAERYDVRRSLEEGGGFEARYWCPMNWPVMNDDGGLRYIVHHIEDVTDLVRVKEVGEVDREASAVLQRQTDRRAAGVVRHSAELTQANTELRAAALVLDSLVGERTAELETSLVSLKAVNKEKQHLLRRIVGLQEEERQRIANDIHDDILQSVIVAQMRLKTLTARPDMDGSIREQVERSYGSITSAVVRLRGLMSELRPDDLDLGVEVALRHDIEEAGEDSKVTTRWATTWQSEPSGVEQFTLYRIAREALINVRKHVAGGLVDVTLSDVKDGWMVSVRDRGAGFEVEAGVSTPGHLGLTAMRERAEALGGWWSIDSVLGCGTTVTAWIPSSSSSAPATR